MPRVIQVASSESHESLARVPESRSTDSSDSEEAENRNYNQRVNIANEPVTTDLKFPVNYSLYNVTYSESETDPYCLKCVIGGQMKQFKKDARTWLHKSSDRKRKMQDGVMINTVAGEYGEMANTNSKINTTEFAKSLRYDMAVDLLGEITYLADSDADLTYSEESSPTVGTSLIELREKITETKSVRFNEDLNTGYRVHSFSSDSDDSVTSLRNATSKRNLTEDTVFIEDIELDIEPGNESRNNVRVAPVPLDVTKIAPAIGIETESYQESLLDYAVNLQNKVYDGNSRPTRSDVKDVGFSSLHATQTLRRMKAKKKREDRTRPYNLRSMMKRQTANNKISKTKKNSIRASCHGNGLKEIATSSRMDVKPATTLINIANSGQTSVSDQMPSCSKDLDDGQECNAVPSLFLLAGRILYKHMKIELNKMT